MAKRRAHIIEAAWTTFYSAVLSPQQQSDILSMQDDLPIAIWKNSRFEVWVYEYVSHDEEDPIVMTHLSIKRRDKQTVRRWRDLQRVKNEVLGPEVEAVEIFPAESRLVDTANQYHLYALPRGMRFPFGYKDRLVMEGGGMGAVQEPFEPDERPADLRRPPASFEEARKMLDGMQPSTRNRSGS